ncbi:hypothetical protein EV715DRAFT_267981 [Schizophyllum commune]
MAPNTRGAAAGSDYNAFGFDPTGRVASTCGLMFGSAWRPDPNSIPRSSSHPAPPRFGPPADYQAPYLPRDFQPQAPPNSYLHAVYTDAVSVDRRQPSRVSVEAEEVEAQDSRKGSEPDKFSVVIVKAEVNREIVLDKDIEYRDFCSRVAANFDIHPDNAANRLGYRIGKYNSTEGARANPTILDDAVHFRRVVDELIGKNKRSTVHTSVLYMYDMDQRRRAAEAKNTAQASKKRSRDDDIPPDADIGSSPAATRALKELKDHTACAKHDGHCYVKQGGGVDTHQALDWPALSFWARKIVRATVIVV